MAKAVFFDEVWPIVQEVLEQSDLPASGLKQLWVVRDLMGRVRLVVPGYDEETGVPANLEQALARCAEGLFHRLGARAYRPEQAVIFAEKPGMEGESGIDGFMRKRLGEMTVYLMDRTVVGGEWAAVPPAPEPSKSLRFSLFSLKGGVGRSTTTAILARYLAERGRRVLVLDLDLESPGLTTALLSRDEHPRWGIVDWFVEDLVDQGDEVVPDMVGRPGWGQDLLGDILVVPAYSDDSKEYIPKLGRVYIDKPPSDMDDDPVPWSKRLRRLVESLENRENPDVVLLDSRSGLHDIAAALVTELNAQVLLFAVDNEATWAGYRILFQHWQTCGAARAVRERLSMIAALVPPRRTGYLDGFREQAWDLFRDTLYDEIPEGSSEGADTEWFSFDLMDEGAPHQPVPIFWNEGLAAVSSPRAADDTAIGYAYHRFVAWFDEWFFRLKGASR